MVQRDHAIQQLSEQSRLLQEQNRQLQNPSRGASEDGLEYAAETESLKLQISMLKEQVEQVISAWAQLRLFVRGLGGGEASDFEIW